MCNTRACKSLLKVVTALWVTLTFSSTILAAGADPELDAVRAKIEGVYALEEWQTEEGVFRPPQVEGRFSMLNGTIIVILHNRMKESPQTTYASYGTYVLTSKEFSYHYPEPSAFTITPASITVSHKLPWEGMRTFTVIPEGDNLRLRSQTGQREWFFTPVSETYSEVNGNTFLKRVWRRILVE